VNFARSNRAIGVLPPGPSAQVAGREVFNGYSGGALVGAFHLNGPRFVAAGGKRPSDYLAGRRVAINKIATDGAGLTLTANCRRSARSTQ